MRLRYAMAALLAVPLADALFLVVVADAIGWQATVLLVVLTGLGGMVLVRAEGRHTLARLRERTARGEVPADQLLDGAFLVAAGAFLLTPGVVTDAIGFAFGLPVTRYPIRAALKRWVVVPYLDERTGGFASGRVWTGGFPDDDSLGGVAGGPGPGSGDGRPGGAGDDVYDVDPEEYSVGDENR